jgi:hypothetical protein
VTPAPAKPVQRFLRLNVTGASGQGTHFTTQSNASQLLTRTEAATPAGELPWEIGHVMTSRSPSAAAPVPVLVSKRLDLAVHDAREEPKEFYCDRAVFDHAMLRLGAVGSYFRLAWTPQTIVVGGAERSRTLNRVVPVPAENAARSFAGGLKDECIEFARLVTGGKPMLARTGEPYSEAAALGLAKQITPPHSGSDPVTAYSSARRSGALRGAQGLGLNEFAAPDVGEAFNYTTLVSDEMNPERSDEDAFEALWKFHFGGVVARSGGDLVALENYKRSALGPVSQLHAELIRRYRERTSGLVRQWHKLRYRGRYDAEFAPIGAPMKAVLRLLQEEAARIGANGEQGFGRLTDDGLKGERWYFRMYGREPGQSFHEQWDHFANGAHGGQADMITMAVRDASRDKALPALPASASDTPVRADRPRPRGPRARITRPTGSE